MFYQQPPLHKIVFELLITNFLCKLTKKREFFKVISQLIFFWHIFWLFGKERQNFIKVR